MPQYAYGRDLRRLVAIVGEEALTDLDQKYLKFADEFERQFITQGDEDRSIEKTLSTAWDLFAMLPEDELKRIKTGDTSGNTILQAVKRRKNAGAKIWSRSGLRGWS